ncbi:hypothetical protein K0M31_017496, partial [Melipona bicolor]
MNGGKKESGEKFCRNKGSGYCESFAGTVEPESVRDSSSGCIIPPIIGREFFLEGRRMPFVFFDDSSLLRTATSLIEKLEDDLLYLGAPRWENEQRRIKISDTMTRFLGNGDRRPFG